MSALNKTEKGGRICLCICPLTNVRLNPKVTPSSCCSQSSLFLQGALAARLDRFRDSCWRISDFNKSGARHPGYALTIGRLSIISENTGGCLITPSVEGRWWPDECRRGRSRGAQGRQRKQWIREINQKLASHYITSPQRGGGGGGRMLMTLWWMADSGFIRSMMMDRSVTEQDVGRAQNCWLWGFKGEHPHADRNMLMWFNVAVRISAGFVCFPVISK